MPFEVFNRLNLRDFKDITFFIICISGVYGQNESLKSTAENQESDFCHFGDDSGVKTEQHWVMAGVLLGAFYGQQLTPFYFHKPSATD